MSTLHKKIILGAAFFFALGFSHVYAAPDDLLVEFETGNAPLFNEANFLPGSEVSRWANVKNNTPGTQPIIVEAINESDPDGLASVFEIGIYEGGVQHYGTTTLAVFFAAGEVSLSDLAGGGAQTHYDFLVRFVPGANNSYQEKSLGFDILIGFTGDEGGGGESGGSSGGGGGGGGEGSILPGLTISGESARTTDVTQTTAIIEWDTSYRSTSRVVYGTTPGIFSFTSSPNYGYPFSTVESDTPANPNGVLHHTASISGLDANTTYYYRTVSHASPDTISFEHSFTTTGTGNTQIEMVLENSFSGSAQNVSHESPSSKPISGGLALQTVDEERIPSENKNIEATVTHTDDSDDSEELPPALFALLFAGLPFSTGLVISFVLVIAIIFFFIWRRSKRKS